MPSIRCAAALRNSWFSYLDPALGPVQVTLKPADRCLVIRRAGGPPGAAWTFDLATRAEGTFQPLTMFPGGQGRAYVAGRIEGTAIAIIERLTFAWAGAEPSFSTEVVYAGSDLADITSMVDVEEVNASLVVFDATNAKLVYVDLADGSVTEVASSASHPELASMLGLETHYLYDPSSGSSRVIGLRHYLQPLQFVSASAFLDATTTTLMLVDKGADGTIDASEVVGPVARGRAAIGS